MALSMAFTALLRPGFFFVSLPLLSHFNDEGQGRGSFAATLLVALEAAAVFVATALVTPAGAALVVVPVESFAATAAAVASVFVA